MRAIALFVGGALLTACDDSSPPKDGGGLDAGPVDAGSCVGAPIALTIGTADLTPQRTFVPLSDGDPVSLIIGPQGGQHIWTAIRGRGFDPTLPRVEMRAYRVTDNALIGRLRIRLPMGPAPEDSTLLGLTAQTLQLDDRAYCTVLGQDVRIEVDLDDLAGKCGSAARTVHLAGIDPTASDALRMSWQHCCDARLPRCYAPDDGGIANGSD